MDHRTDWMHKRGITDEVIERFGIECVEDSPIGPAIKIPVRDERGNFLFNKYRRDPLSDDKPKYVYDKGGKVALFGFDKTTGRSEGFSPRSFVITEGEMDALVCWSKNIEAVSSTGGAGSWREEWSELFEEGDEIIFAFDNDDAGAQGMVKGLKIFPTAKILLIPEMPNGKDISDYVARGGDLHQLLQSARHYEGIDDIREERLKRMAVFLPVRFHDAHIKQWEEDNFKAMRVPRTRVIGGTDVEQAKQYPIKQLLRFGERTGKAVCPFHSEKTGSLHLYKEQNRTWCFGGCGKGYDAIDIYMKLHGVSFKEAVSELNRI